MVHRRGQTGNALVFSGLLRHDTSYHHAISMEVTIDPVLLLVFGQSKSAIFLLLAYA